MPEIVVQYLKGDDVTEDHVSDPKELEHAIDADIAAFDEYFQRELKNDPLVRPERAILKTYLHYKARLQSES
jgi:hypothetical protein